MYPDKQIKMLTANFHNTTRIIVLSNYPKGWKQWLAMITEESDKINATSNINVVKKIMYWGKIVSFFVQQGQPWSDTNLQSDTLQSPPLHLVDTSYAWKA